MKQLILIAALLLAITISYGQVITPNYRTTDIDWGLHPNTEEWVLGSMLVGSFLLLEYLRSTGPITNKQWHTAALISNGAVIGTFVIFRINDKCKKRK